MFFTSSRIADFLILLLTAVFLLWDVLSGGFMAADHLIPMGIGGAGYFLGCLCMVLERAGWLKMTAGGLSSMLIGVALARLIQMAWSAFPAIDFSITALLVIGIVAIVLFAVSQIVPDLFRSQPTENDGDDDEDVREPAPERTPGPTMIHVGRHRVPLGADGYISIR